jgi:hypothetical protein
MQEYSRRQQRRGGHDEKTTQLGFSGYFEEVLNSGGTALQGPERRAWMLCHLSPAYFIYKFCRIDDKISREWVPFTLWQEQYHTLKTLYTNQQVIILKARQLGLTWLVICRALWMMIFQPGCGILLFSRRQDEASDLLDRLRGVHQRLPDFLQQELTVDNTRELRFGQKDSWARAFSTTKHSGRSYSATLAIIDEADHIPELQKLLNAVKPTIDAGGSLVLVSTINKEKRSSGFKHIWNQAAKGSNNYTPIFLPWYVRPDRDEAWYQEQAEDYEEDDLYQEYPSTPEQALAPRKESKRFSLKWIEKSKGDRGPRTTSITVPGFTCFTPPSKGRQYLLAADPAEGNPSSDPSAASIFDEETWEQAGVIHGKFEPDIFAGYLIQMAEHYNQAMICWERNNHGHAVEVALKMMGYENIYISPFDKKPGWLSNRKNKVLAVDMAAQVMREGSVTIHDQATINELAMFEATTLSAPQGESDDLAMSVIIAIAALYWKSHEERKGEGISEIISGEDPIENLKWI